MTNPGFEHLLYLFNALNLDNHEIFLLHSPQKYVKLFPSILTITVETNDFKYFNYYIGVSKGYTDSKNHNFSL